MSGRWVFAVLVVLIAGMNLGPARGQEDLTRGKTPAQLYASDCADCHRDPHSVVKMSAGQIESFLREHYTASKQSAALLTRYLTSLGPEMRTVRKRPERPASDTSEAKRSPPSEHDKQPQTTAAPADKPAEKADTKQTEKPGEATAAKPEEPAGEKKTAPAEEKPAAVTHEAPTETKEKLPAAASEVKPSEPTHEKASSATTAPPANPQ